MIPWISHTSRFWERWDAFCADNGWLMERHDPFPDALDWRPPRAGYWIACVAHGEDCHAIVMEGDRLAFDPNHWSPRRRRPTRLTYSITLDPAIPYAH